MAIPERCLSEVEKALSTINGVLDCLRGESTETNSRAAFRAERDAEISMLMIMRLMTSVTEVIEDKESARG